MHDVWANQILFWSVVGGFLTPFPLVYIPVINDVVFKHTSISWQWAPAFVATGIFMIFAEAYKYAKRVFIRRRHAKHPEEDDGMTGVFSAWKTIDPTTRDGKDVV